MKGQIVAIVSVIACGIGTFLMSMTTLETLKWAKDNYYERYSFAHVFCNLKRAPNSLTPRIEAIPGVARVQTRVERDVTLDLPQLREPAVGRLISIPENGRLDLNQLHLRLGRYLQPGRPDEVLCSEAFAEAHHFKPGDHLVAIINGKRRQLEIVGIALSPEYIYQIRGGVELVPDNKRFGVLWMGRQALSAAYQMEGGFNSVAVELMRGASEREVIRELDRLLETYGGLGAYGRNDHLSNKFVSDEIQQLGRMGFLVPSMFLAVSGFLLNVVLSRLVSLQRDQIAVLKAFGYTHVDVGWHYLKLVLAVVALGTILGCYVGYRLGKMLTGIYLTLYHFPQFNYLFPSWLIVVSAGIAGGAATAGVLNVIRLVIALPPAEAMRPEPPASFRRTIFERIGLWKYISNSTRMILRNLEWKPVKALFSAFGISLAVAVIILGNFVKDSLDVLLEVQYDVVQLSRMNVGFVEPSSYGALDDVRHLPGVLYAEPVRTVPTRMRVGHLMKRVVIRGVVPETDLFHLVNDDLSRLPIPPDGLVLNTKLAELLGLKIGDRVRVEVLDGKRPVRDVYISGLTSENLGTTAYMNFDALNRLMEDGRALTAVYALIDDRYEDDLFRFLKRTPRIAGVGMKRLSISGFRDTVVRNLMQMQRINIGFAAIIAFGVVYNTARIALSERSRELATLRVIGFTRGEISYILLGELAVLTIIALPMGMVIGYSLAWAICRTLNTELYRIPLVIHPSTFASAVVVVLVSTVISGLTVCRTLNRLDLIGVLKTRE